jgi:hypothetical protein
MSDDQRAFFYLDDALRHADEIALALRSARSSSSNAGHIASMLARAESELGAMKENIQYAKDLFKRRD